MAKNRVKRSIEWARNASDLWTILTYVLPPSGAVAVIVLNWAQQWVGTPPVPPVYLFLAALAAFALVALGMKAYLEFVYLNSPKFKVKFAQYMTTMTREKKADGTEFVKYIVPAFLVQSTAKFPVSYIVDEFVCEIAGRKTDPNDPELRTMNKGGVVQPESPSGHRGLRIDVEGVNFTPKKNGEVFVRIRYGRPGKERYILEKRDHIVANGFVDAAGKPSVNVEYFHKETASG